jgi:ketosteroid isomerase-like protein
MLIECGTNKIKERANSMNKILTCLVAALISFSAMADQHSSPDAAVRNAVKAFNGAYAVNNVEDYFNHYTDDALLYWSGARQKVSAYHEEWTELVDAGGAVEKNELSDIQVKVMPSGNVAVASYFIDYRLREPDGEVIATEAFETDVWQKIDGAWKVVSLHYTEIPPE